MNNSLWWQANNGWTIATFDGYQTQTVRFEAALVEVRSSKIPARRASKETNDSLPSLAGWEDIE